MKIEQEKLILGLIEHTNQVLNETKLLNELNLEQLNYKTNPESWSILECIAHLNLYGDYYLPEIKNKMASNRSKPKVFFKSGLLGNYFAKSMFPKDKLNKMKTFKDKNPIGSNLDRSTMNSFIEQQKETIVLLDKALLKDLNKIKTGITIASWIKLKLGDTFRVVVYHNQRHIVQAKNVLQAQTK